MGENQNSFGLDLDAVDIDPIKDLKTKRKYIHLSTTFLKFLQKKKGEDVYQAYVNEDLPPKQVDQLLSQYIASRINFKEFQKVDISIDFR